MAGRLWREARHERADEQLLPERDQAVLPVDGEARPRFGQPGRSPGRAERPPRPPARPPGAHARRGEAVAHRDERGEGSRRHDRPGPPADVLARARNRPPGERTPEPDVCLVRPERQRAHRARRGGLQQAPTRGHDPAAAGARRRTSRSPGEQTARRARVHPVAKPPYRDVPARHPRGRRHLPRRGGARGGLPLVAAHVHHELGELRRRAESRAGARPAFDHRADDGQVQPHARRRAGGRLEGIAGPDRPGRERAGAGRRPRRGKSLGVLLGVFRRQAGRQRGLLWTIAGCRGHRRRERSNP